VKEFENCVCSCFFLKKTKQTVVLQLWRLARGPREGHQLQILKNAAGDDLEALGLGTPRFFLFSFLLSFSGTLKSANTTLSLGTYMEFSDDPPAL
jgi:hypothetical protein